MTTEKQKTGSGAANGASAGAQAANQPRRKGERTIVIDDALWEDLRKLQAVMEETKRRVEILHEREFGVKPKRSS